MEMERDRGARSGGSGDDRSHLPGAPQGYPVRRGPSLPQGIEEPGEVPTIDEMAEPTAPNDTRIYAGDLEAEGADAAPELSLDGLVDLELRPDETTDPIEASEEGLTFVPPSDPVIAGTEADGDPIVAAGFSPDALYEPYDDSHHGTWDLDEDEVVERVRDALRADAQTTAFAETLEIEVDGERAVIRGSVPDLEDVDAVLAVAERVTGISEVEDRLAVEAIDQPGADPRGSRET